MSFEVITFATHSERMFPQLMDSEYPIKVVGWGVKWDGFHTKIKGVLEYVKTKNPDDIIVCVDAFDTKISGDPSEAEKLFRDMGCGFLVSKDGGTVHSQVIFGTCKDGDMANMGLWMGYVKYIIPILEDILDNTCKDDQIMFNSVCHKHNYICIDTEKIIFSNYSDEGIFNGYPMTMTLEDSIKRQIKEMLPHYIIHISLVVYALTILLPKHRKYILAIYIIVFLIFLFKGDKTCMFKQRTNT